MSYLDIPQEFITLIERTASPNKEEADAAKYELAEAIQSPLRQGVLSGDILGDIFQTVPMKPGAAPIWELDFLAPGTERDFVAYTIPHHGRLGEATIEADHVTVPTYEVGNSIDWTRRFARDARYDVVNRAIEVLKAGFVKKLNDDGWHLLLTAAVDRNILVFDSDAQIGQFTKRLVSLMKTIVRRNGGGNSTSMNRGKLTDIYMSPESMEDIRNWGVDLVDEITRREIFQAADVLNRIFGVNLHDLDELGEGQEYQIFYETVLAGTYATTPDTDVELLVGLDLTNRDSFIMPQVEPLTIYPRPSLVEQRRDGMFAIWEGGFAALDNRRIVLASA